MIRTSLCALLLAFSGLAAAQFLSEEEYWRRVFGFDLTELDDFKAQVREEADRLNALEARLQRCGSCSERESLAAELERRDADLRHLLAPMCSAMMAFSGIGFGVPNGVEEISELTGVARLCREVGRRIYHQAKSETEAELRAQWQAKARSGRPEDIFALASYYAKFEDRIDLACPYFLLAARKGHAPAVSWLGRCGTADAGESFELTRTCAEKGDANCMYTYGLYFASSRNPATPSPVAVDDNEALRWWDRAAEKGLKVAETDAARLRQRMRDGTRAGTDSAPPPSQPPSRADGTAPSNPPEARPRRSGRQAACDRRAERLERERKRAATRPQDKGVQRALGNLEEKFRADCS